MTQPPIVFKIRPISSVDDLEEITRLIHSAYAAHAALGLRFWGTHQSVADTSTRFALGQGFLAESNGQPVGTITVRPPQPDSPIHIYRDPITWSISQFAVSPHFKGTGLGKALHEVALDHASQNGCQVMALDTAVPAIGLIAMYRSWGYKQVCEHSWQPQTNYMSVVMCRPMGASAHNAL